MADFDKIKINGTAYNVKDTATAQAVAQVKNDLAETNETVQQQGQQITQQGQQITQQGQQITQQGQQIAQQGQQIQQETTERETAIAELKEQINNQGTPNTKIFLALFHNQSYTGDNNAIPKFYLTSDGDTFSRIVNKQNNGIWPTLPAARDGSLYFTNSTFYIACTDANTGDFTVYYSRDFINWGSVEIDANLPSGDIWAPDIDEFSSNTAQLGIFVTANTTLYYVNVPLVSGVPQRNASSTSLGVTGHIDPCATNLVFRNSETQRTDVVRCILLKNETTKRLEIYSYSTNQTLSHLSTYDPGDAWPAGIEGFSTMQLGGCTKILFDYYYSTSEDQHDTQFIGNGTTLGGSDYWNVVKPVVFDDDPGYNIQGCRHGSVLELNNEMINIINNACILYNNGLIKGPRKNPVATFDLSDPQNGFTIIPYHVYRITGTAATIPQPLNPFGLKEYDLLIASDNMNLTCSQTPEGSVTVTIENKHGTTVRFVQSKGTLFSPIV